MIPNTLTRHLFIRIAPTILVTIIAIGWLAFYSATKEINTVYDAQLITNANVLWTLISDEMREAEEKGPMQVGNINLNIANQLALNDSADDYADSRMFRVWKGGKLLLYSDTAPPQSFPMSHKKFSVIDYKSDEWRVYVLSIPGSPASIEVGEKIELRKTLVLNILLDLALPLLLLLPIVGMLGWLGIGSGLGMIRSLVQQIHSRSPDDLSQVDLKDLPLDLLPLGKSVNQLLTKLDHSLKAERRFADHAAHQLRTPLAILKLQLQMLAQCSSENERESLIQELLASVDRATKLVGQLLTLARLGNQLITLSTISLYPAVTSIMAEVGALAAQKHIEMSLEGEANALVRADEALLKLMLINIIENAIKYTPEGGKIQVRIDQQDRSWKISVSDTGAGIPEEQRKLVFERFYRGDTPDVEGSGLGLAIVAEIVERFSGSIRLETPLSGRGLLVKVLLPKA